MLIIIFLHLSKCLHEILIYEATLPALDNVKEKKSQEIIDDKAINMCDCNIYSMI